MLMNFNSSYIGIREDLLQHVKGEGLVILDVGCATGVNGQFLKDKKIAKEVIGIELDPLMAKEAQGKIDRVVVGNIESGTILEELEGKKFDIILLGDVLEHLYDPWNVLKELTSFLSTGGRMIISVPNIQHIELFISVYLKGEWQYNERGIFDKTHLRWFTYKNILRLEEKCSIKIKKIERKYRFRDRKGAEFPLFFGHVLKKVFPSFFTFQYVVIAERADSMKKD
jgi:2-polyprenyl-3-methyl-5-hydroxy-6-metoxy-1,4-benzoquinol methylase